MSYKLIERKQFVNARYENFLKKRKWIKDNGMGSFTIQTDLDKKYIGFDKPMKEIIICDRCNEDIIEPTFIMFEEERCYHRNCIEHELPKEFEDKIENVVFVDFNKGANQ